jgi:hypothetical protein
MVLIALKDAAAEGASYAATFPTRTVEIQERAADSSNALVELSPDMISIDYVDPPTMGQPITVTIAYDYVIMNPVINAIVPDGALTMRAVDARAIY